MAAQSGLSVLLVELEGRPGPRRPPSAATGPLDYEDVELFTRGPPGRCGAAGSPPTTRCSSTWRDHGFQRVSRRLVSAGVIDVVSTAIPGIRDVLVLGKVKQLERAGAADLIIVDAPATGHAVTFLTSASGLLDAARGGPDPGPGGRRPRDAERPGALPGPARHPARGACRSPRRSRPPTGWRTRPGVQLGPRDRQRRRAAWPRARRPPRPRRRPRPGSSWTTAALAALEASAGFALHRHGLQAAQIERLAAELPLPQLQLPALADPGDRAGELEQLAAALGDGVAGLDPEAAVAVTDAPAESVGDLAAERAVIVCARDRAGSARRRSRPPSPSRRPGRAAGPASSRSTRPGGWPTRWGSRPSPTRRRRSRASFPGTLHALMLDTKGTFDDLVDRNAALARPRREAIRANRIYQNLTGMLSGTQEYMAMEKLYELTESGRLRPRGGRHPARPATPSTSSTRRAGSPGSSRTGCSGPCSPRPGRRCGSSPSRPRRCCGPSPGSPGPRSSRTPSTSSRPSRAWRRASVPGPGPSGTCWPTRRPRTCSSPRLGPTRSRRPPTSPPAWPTPGSSRPRWS